ncbi:MAG TPA: SlyX family protein [Lacunisphaera sp.]|nr:SlyX family protein [Lacunisphaera sp.]
MTEAERLTLLEERYAHLQRHVAQQDQAMLELGDELARLRRELQALRAQVAGGAPDGDGAAGAAEERPPHY